MKTRKIAKKTDAARHYNIFRGGKGGSGSGAGGRRVVAEADGARRFKSWCGACRSTLFAVSDCDCGRCGAPTRILQEVA